MVADWGLQTEHKKKPRHKTGFQAHAGADEFVDDVRHQDEHDAVRIDVRFASEGRRIDWIETLVEGFGDAIELRGIEAAGGRKRVDVYRHLALHRTHSRDDPSERRAVESGAHHERALIVQRGRTGLNRPPFEGRGALALASRLGGEA